MRNRDGEHMHGGAQALIVGVCDPSHAVKARPSEYMRDNRRKKELGGCEEDTAAL